MPRLLFALAVLIGWLPSATVVGAHDLLGPSVAPPGDDTELPEWMRKRLRGKDSSPPAPTEPSPIRAPSGSPDREVRADDSATEAEVPPVFRLGQGISMRSVRPPESTRRFALGVSLRIAPVRAVTKAQLNKYRAQNPELGSIVDLAQRVDLDKAETMSGGEIQALFLSIDGLTQQERSAIESVDFEEEKPALVTLIDVANDPEEAIAFSLEPSCTLNVGPVGMTILLPLAGFTHGDETAFEVGNVTLDTRFGHYFDAEPAIAGLSYGVSLSAPTGTERVDALALSGVLESPKYLHAYLGVEPYLAFGMDFRYVIFQAELGVSHLNGVRDDAHGDAKTYFRYGTGLVLAPVEFVGLIAEVAGSRGLVAADAFDILMVTAGLRLHVLGVEPAAAIQVPVVRPDAEAYGGNTGLAFGSPADINVILQLSFGL